jgi:hypothetical protein
MPSPHAPRPGIAERLATRVACVAQSAILDPQSEHRCR